MNLSTPKISTKAKMTNKPLHTKQTAINTRIIHAKRLLNKDYMSDA
jgi:hypothetical protein